LTWVDAQQRVTVLPSGDNLCRITTDLGPIVRDNLSLAACLVDLAVAVVVEPVGL